MSTHHYPPTRAARKETYVHEETEKRRHKGISQLIYKMPHGGRLLSEQCRDYSLAALAR